jgi:cytosine/adenosine deaminase-related metal-dependent hydrolase
MKRLLFLLLFAATLEARPIVFINVTVIPMTSDAVLTKQVVIVDDGRIVAVGKEGEVVIPSDAQRIDGEGGYLLPGLIDLHVHVSQPDDLSLYVVNGVTTVFNLSGDESTLDLRKGARLMPRLFTTGKQLVGVQTAANAKQIVDDEAAAGYDGIKIYNDISLDALGALIAEAHAKGMLAVGHIPRNLRWQDMLAARPDAIAHAEEFLYSPVLDGDDTKIVAGMKEGGIALITTLIAYDRIGRQVGDLEAELDRGESRYVNPAIRRMWDRAHNHYMRDFKPARVPNFRRLLRFQKQLIKELDDGGVPILLGTDAGGVPFVIPGFSAIDELRELVSAGLTPYHALQGATIGAARLLRKDAELGTIEPGKSADLLLVRGNPLTDIENIALRAGVMVRGRWLDNAALHAELDRIALANRDDEEVVQMLSTHGVDAAIKLARTKTTRDSTLNELAYQLLLIDKRHDDALRLFRANAALHPQSLTARESLKEVLGVGSP